MGEKKEIRVKFEIGEIKFEAEGSADLVERERSIFNNTLLPAAIDAIVRTRSVPQSAQYIETQNSQQPAVLTTTNAFALPEQAAVNSTIDFSRMSLLLLQSQKAQMHTMILLSVLFILMRSEMVFHHFLLLLLKSYILKQKSLYQII